MRRVRRWHLRRRLLGTQRPWLRGLVLLALAPVAAAYVWLLFLPWPVLLLWFNPQETSFMEQRAREARREGRELVIQQQWVPLKDISANLRRAVLTSEDDRFYQHAGIDWKALATEVHYQADTTFSWWSPKDLHALWDALEYARAHRSDIKGRSTITQQVAKNLYFSSRRSLVRKVAEAVVAKRLELILSKERILEIYLNVAEWGPGIFGAQAAAQTYFHRSASQLTLEQAAALAATLPQPLSSNPDYRPSRMNWRKDLILDRLTGPLPPAPPPVSEPAPPDTGAGDLSPSPHGERDR